jgi:hypothetical protein
VKKIFLLSPAHAGGERARMILNERAEFDLAVGLRLGTSTIGELFAFVSGLYFRGKIAYATAFADPPGRLPPALVITPNRGLLPPDTPITLDEFRAMAEVPVDIAESRYREPLVRDARIIAGDAGPNCAFVLLGSVATPKYVQPFLNAFGERLVFPKDFAGRGDMSRGGLMLRCADSGAELEYVPVGGGTLHGPRPPKLQKRGGA